MCSLLMFVANLLQILHWIEANTLMCSSEIKKAKTKRKRDNKVCCPHHTNNTATPKIVCAHNKQGKKKTPQIYDYLTTVRIR